MSGNQTDADNHPLNQGNSDTQGGYSLAEALRALEPEIERELADLDEALGELRDAAAVERVSTTVAKPATPCDNGQAPKPRIQIRPAAPFVHHPALKLAANGGSSFVAPPRQSRPAGGQPRVEVPLTARPNPQQSFKQAVPIKPAPVPPRRAEAEPVATARTIEPPHRPEANRQAEGMVTIDGDNGPIPARPKPSPGSNGNGGSGSGGGASAKEAFHQRLTPVEFTASLKAAVQTIRKNLAIVMVFTVACNVLVLAIPIYLFQISDRILTSRSLDTLVMLTLVIVGAIFLQAMFDAVRRIILMRTAVEFAAQLGAPVLSAAARASLHSNGKEYQTLGDLQQVRSFLVSRTLLSFLDAPIAPLFIVAIFLIHPHLGWLVVLTGVILLVITLLNQRATAKPFGEANAAQVKANLHLDSMSRNSQIINALAMIPEAVGIWGKDTATSLTQQVIAQDRNVIFASISKAARLLTQVAMLGWGAYLAIEGEIT